MDSIERQDRKPFGACSIQISFWSRAHQTKNYRYRETASVIGISPLRHCCLRWVNGPLYNGHWRRNNDLCRDWIGEVLKICRRKRFRSSFPFNSRGTQSPVTNLEEVLCNNSKQIIFHILSFNTFTEPRLFHSYVLRQSLTYADLHSYYLRKRKFFKIMFEILDYSCHPLVSTGVTVVKHIILFFLQKWNFIHIESQYCLKLHTGKLVYFTCLYWLEVD